MLIDISTISKDEMRRIELSAKSILRDLGFRDAQHVREVLAKNGCYIIQ